MEKLLRRSLLNRNQLVTKKRRESAKDVRRTWRDFNRMRNLQSTSLERILKSERQARREDWMMGPIAPKRDAGIKQGTYGAVDTLMGQGPALPKGEVRGPRGQGFDAMGSEDRRLPGFEDGEWKGEGLAGNLVVGDRVVVVKGREGVKGKIGEVFRIDSKTDMIFVKNVNKVDMTVPPQSTGLTKEKTFEQELPIHIENVRLITQIVDPVTRATKDAIVRQIHGGAPHLQRNPGSNLPRHTRYLKGTSSDGSDDVVIPWPKEDADRYYTHSCDTTRDVVEEVTYFPEVFQSVPVPASAVDELRGKHSRQRRDFDDVENLKRKMLIDARRDWFEMRSRVLSEPFWTKEYMLRQQRVKKETEELMSASL